MVFGVDDAAYVYAGATAAAAASGAYSANQASQTSAGNAQMANMTNMVMQAQNQDFNSAEALKMREFNSKEALDARRFTYDEGVRAREFNASQADIQRQWAADQSSTAYQRAVSDMKAAGLNPMLAYKNGGADTASGSSASSSAGSGASASGGAASSGGWGGAQKADVFPMNLGANMASNALDALAFKSKIDNLDADTKLKNTAAGVNVKTEEHIGAQIANTKETLQDIIATYRKKGMETRLTETENRIREKVLGVFDKMNELEQGVKKGTIGSLEAEVRMKNIRTDLYKLDIPEATRAAEQAGSAFAKGAGYAREGAGVIGSVLGVGQSAKRLLKGD